MTRWKLHRDSFYSSAAALGVDVVEAGFFEDASTGHEPVSADPPCTSLYLVRRRMAGVRRPLALVTTGAHAPAHRGHVAMMEAAKATMEVRGYDVVGGFISVGHDEYVTAKLGRAMPAPLRLKLTANLVKDSGWLAVDPWEALHRRVAVNFTDVVARTEVYLRHHLGREVEVAYVCGGDNARFALAFAARGLCVVVARPGADGEVERYRRHPLLADNPRVAWVGSVSNESSTAARACQEVGWARPDGVTLRVERDDPAYITACQMLCEAASEYIAPARLVHVQEQRAVAAALVGDQPWVSLDPLIPGPYNLGLSRLFDIGGYAMRCHIARPGRLSLEEQVARIPPGEYVLFDDDSVTGGTMRAAVSTLGDRVRIVRKVTLESGLDGRWEVLDCRDLLGNHPDAGLVVEQPNGSSRRVPYTYPWVCPHARASVDPARCAEFSAAVEDVKARLRCGTR